MKGALATVLVLLGLLAATVVVSFWAWRSLGDVELGFHGSVALLLGVGATLAIAAGLVGLMMYSSRRGYDEAAHRQGRHRDQDGR